MIRSPQELTIAIRSAVNRRAIIASHIVIATTMTVHTALWPATEPYENYLTALVVAVTLLLLIIRFLDLAKINDRPLVFIVLYEILVFFGLTFVTEAATPYILMPLIPMWLANLYYGAKGVYATVGMVAAATVTKLLLFAYDKDIGRENTLDIIAAFFAFAAIASFFVNLQKVYDWERTRLRSTLKEATIGQKRLRTLINSMTESVLVLDKNGAIRLYNAAALALFNTNTSLEGKNLANCVKLETEKGKAVTIEELLVDNGSAQTREDVVIRYSEEDSASLSLTVTPLRTSFGDGDDYTGFILTMRDITREKSLEEERNEFISVISHELRTPVTVTEASLSNALYVSEHNGDKAAIDKALITAHDQAIYLANMLNDLSTFARAEKGTLQLDLEDIEPAQLIEQLKVDYRGEAAAKGLSLATSVDEKARQHFVSNRLYIREILQNFITNSIKYSDSGTITILVQPGDDNSVRFLVKDEGIGISRSDQKRVFDKFFRSEDFRTRSSAGTGLGLYIVHKLAKLLEGKLGLSSEVGHGSEFSLTVPDLSAKLHENRQPAEKGSEQTVDEPQESDGPAARQVQHAADLHLQKQR